MRGQIAAMFLDSLVEIKRCQTYRDINDRTFQMLYTF